MGSSFFRDVAWDKFGSVGEKWMLRSYPQRKPPSWNDFWANEREYWRADDPDKSRVQLYFGKENTEQNLLASSKQKYASYKEYLLHWHGLCKIGETIQVIELERKVLALSKNWKGSVSDHSDLEVWLKEERTWYLWRKRFCCEIYSFGTLVNPAGSIPVQMGEPAGTFRVSHRRGESRSMNETVSLDDAGEIVEIGDAQFYIVG